MYQVIVAICCLLAIPSTALASGPFIVDSTIRIRYASGKTEALLSELAPILMQTKDSPNKKVWADRYVCIYSTMYSGSTAHGPSIMCGIDGKDAIGTFAWCDMYTIGYQETSRLAIIGWDKKGKLIEIAQIVVSCRTTAEYQK